MFSGKQAPALTVQGAEKVQGGQHVVSFAAAKPGPFNRRVQSVAPEVRPENRKISPLIYFHPQVEQQGAVASIPVQKDYHRRSFGASEKPTASGRAVAVSPVFFGHFQGPGRAAYLGECLGVTRKERCGGREIP